MRVRFLCHASVEVQTLGRRLVCDPWFSGKVFNDAWALISPPPEPNSLDGVEYLWISHEHPDHFHLPSLRAVPPDQRTRMTVLYQAHASPRIVRALRQLGFERISELPLSRWTGLESGLEVYCGSVGSMDSFLAVRAEGQCVLNLNDCVLSVPQLTALKRAIGHVSVLLTQFSFANWVGNESDEVGGASRKVRQLEQQIRILRPERTVPFASFSYFCNTENARHNAWANTPADIAALGLPGIHFMYPGDTLDLAATCAESAEAASREAVTRYMTDYATRRNIDPPPAPVPLEQVTSAIAERLSQTAASPVRWLLRACAPFDIHIKDHDTVVSIDPGRQICRVHGSTPEAARQARYEMCSQVAWYTFAYPWGPATTQVGGMYLDRAYARAGANRFFRLQNLLATEVFRGGDADQVVRSARFWWAKRQEVFFRLTQAFQHEAVTD